MQNIQQILPDQITPSTLRKISSTTNTERGFSEELAMELCNSTFVELKSIFTGWRASLDCPEAIKAYKQSLLESMIANRIGSQEKIDKALVRAKEESVKDHFIPPAERVISWCRPRHEFPEPMEAYAIAGKQVGKHPKHRSWGHDVVAWTAKEIGSFDLQTKTEREIFPRFKAVYKSVCDRWLAGERPTVPEERRIEKTETPPASKETNIKNMASLKSLLAG